MTRNENKATKMKVFLVEDSALLRERLLQSLSSVSGVTLSGHADTAESAIQLIQQTKPDAVILDIRLRQGTGLQVLQSIKSPVQVQPYVIVLTNFPYPQYRKKYIESGANYFFDKSNEFDQILVVLRQLLDATGRGEHA
jgi:DNA-binding NarL/FixJ family response regulator